MNHAWAQRLQRLLAATGGRCVYCHQELDLCTVTIDHVVPRSKGGLRHVDNEVPACRECNRRKADLDVSVFLHAGTWWHKVPPAVVRSDVPEVLLPELKAVKKKKGGRDVLRQLYPSLRWDGLANRWVREKEQKAGGLTQRLSLDDFVPTTEQNHNFLGPASCL